MPAKSFGPFSGRQLTTIIVAAILVLGVPGTVFAVDTFSNVAIQDPVSGVKASVDAQHRLKTLDTLSGSVLAAETPPANIVQFFGGAGTACATLYTVPAGKALILKTANGYLFKEDSASAELDLYNGCSAFVAAFTSDHVAETVNEDFGPGIVFRAGSKVSVTASAGGGSVHGYGYLVPSSAVPASAVGAPADAERPAGGLASVPAH
jgi:hypothetical protein